MVGHVARFDAVELHLPGDGVADHARDGDGARTGEDPLAARDGVGRVEAFVVLVPGGDLGERVRVRIESVEDSFATAEPLEGGLDARG